GGSTGSGTHAPGRRAIPVNGDMNMTIFLRGAITLALFGFASLSALYAQQHNAPELSTATVITSTQPNQITIRGVNFGSVMPSITLDGLTLIVLTHTDTAVVAFLPTGFAPGTYRLSLTNNSLQGNPDVRT